MRKGTTLNDFLILREEYNDTGSHEQGTLIKTEKSNSSMNRNL